MLFAFWNIFFRICLCLLLFFLSFLCPCSPCRTTSRWYWLPEGLPCYQQSQNLSASLEAISEVLQISVSLLLALHKHDCSFISGFLGSRSIFSSGELTCPPAQFVKLRLVSIMSENGQDIYPWLESCSCGGWLALSFWSWAPTTVPVFSHHGGIFAAFTCVFSLSIVLWSCLQKVNYSLSHGHDSIGGKCFSIFYNGRINTSTLCCCLWNRALKLSVQSCFWRCSEIAPNHPL